MWYNRARLAAKTAGIGREQPYIFEPACIDRFGCNSRNQIHLAIVSQGLLEFAINRRDTSSLQCHHQVTEEEHGSVFGDFKKAVDSSLKLFFMLKEKGKQAFFQVLNIQQQVHATQNN